MIGTKIYANAVAKYNEGRLLDREKIRRLSEADFDDAVKMLCDYGYGGGTLQASSYDIDGLLSRERTALIAYAQEDAPDAHLSACLVNRYRYANAKVWYKNKFVPMDLGSALYEIAGDETQSAIESGEYERLPAELAAALRLLDTTFASQAVSPQVIDAVLTQAMYDDSLRQAKRSGSKLMRRYLQAEIDLKNILYAVRAKSLGLSTEQTHDGLLRGGTVTSDDLLLLRGDDPEAAQRAFWQTPYDRAVADLLQSGDAVRFETFIDDYLGAVTADDRDNMLSLSPFLAYFTAKETELKVVKMILVCLKNGARDQIGKRMRALYGD